jgi:hypothetical protein
VNRPRRHTIADLSNSTGDRFGCQPKTAVDQGRAHNGAMLATEAILQLNFARADAAQDAATFDAYAELRKAHVGRCQISATR